MSLEHSPARQHRVPSNAWTIPREFFEWAKQHGVDAETLLLRMRQLEERLIGEAECRVITNLYQPAVVLTRLGFPNQLQHDSRWQTEGRLPWGLPLRYGRTIPAKSFAGWQAE